MNNNFGWWVVNNADFIYFVTSNPVEDRQGWQTIWVICNVSGPYLESWRKSWQRGKWNDILILVKSCIQFGRFLGDLVWCLSAFRCAWAWLTVQVRICLVLMNNQALWVRGAHDGMGHQCQGQRRPLAQGHDPQWTSAWGRWAAPTERPGSRGELPDKIQDTQLSLSFI